MTEEKQQLVILPGWEGSHDTWASFVQKAKKYFSVQVIDLPCFGDEPCPNIVWGVEEYSKFVESKIKKQKTKIILLGHSFGGQVAALLTSKHPELVNKLILSGAAIIRPEHKGKRLFFWIVAKGGKKIISFFQLQYFEFFGKKILYHIAHSPDYTQTNGIKRDIYQKIIRQDVQYILSNISVSTLVVWGKQDRMVPVHDANKIAKQIPDAIVHLIPYGTHGLHHKKTQDQLLKIIQDFVA